MTTNSERTLYDRSFEDNPVYNRVFERLPKHIASSFSREQLEAIYWASSYQRAEHRLAIRRRFSFFGGRYYLAIFFGRDRRRKANEVDEVVLNGLREPWTRTVGRWMLRGLVFAALLLLIAVVAFPVLGVVTRDFIADPATYQLFRSHNPGN